MAIYTFRKTAIAVGCIALLSTNLLASDSELTVLEWAGFDDPALFSAYIDKHGVAPQFSLFANEDEAFQKLRFGFKADVAHPCSRSIPKWIDAGLIEPIDTSRITHWDKLDPNFRDIPEHQRNGAYYFVPVDWGNTAVTYNPDFLSDADVASLQEFADPKYAGHVSIGANIEDAYSLAFLATGVMNWRTVTDAQFEAASAFLRQVHKNIRTYWNDADELTIMMASGEIHLSWAWNETFVLLSNADYPIAWKRDTREGSASWVCGFSKLTGGEGSDDKFYDFVNAWLEPETADVILNTLGYGHSNTAAMEKYSAEHLANLGLETSDELLENTFWQSPPPEKLRQKMIAEYELIKAGF